MSEFLTVAQIAHRLDVSPETVRRWLRTQRLTGFDLGDRAGWRVKPEDLERFLRDRVSFDEAQYDELYRQLVDAGWGISESAYSSFGVTVTLRRWSYTSTFPGVPTFTVFGKNRTEAVRSALAQLEAWDASNLDSKLDAAGWQVEAVTSTPDGEEVMFRRKGDGWSVNLPNPPIAVGKHLYDAIRAFLEQLEGKAED